MSGGCLDLYGAYGGFSALYSGLSGQPSAAHKRCEGLDAGIF